MARKFGKVNTMSPHFYDYNYVINGVGGIGKTTMAFELGQLATGSNEGTFIITCGSEPEPKHIPGAFGDLAKTFDIFVDIVKDLCENREDYKDTKFVAIDSLDEFFRIAEDYVVREWNTLCKRAGHPEEGAKSISQAYKGFQKGESRVVDIVLKALAKLADAGYQILYLGHTKTKAKEDLITGIKYEQLTCNLDNKYYNAIKDKTNLVAMCYFENQIENIVEEKNPFNKKKEKKGDLVSKNRVMVFVDDDNAIDTKTHFEYIVNKAPFGAQYLKEAVESAIQAKLNAPIGEHKSPEHVEFRNKTAMVDDIDVGAKKDVAVDVEDDLGLDGDGVDALVDDVEISKEERIAIVKKAFASADTETKKAVKAIIVKSGDGTGKLNEAIPDADLANIEKALGL